MCPSCISCSYIRVFISRDLNHRLDLLTSISICVQFKSESTPYRTVPGTPYGHSHTHSSCLLHILICLCHSYPTLSLQFLVGNVVELLQLENEAENEDGSAQDVDDKRAGQSVVIKTSTRQTIFLPVIGLVPAEELVPGDLVGTNKDSYLILEKLPSEYDSRVKAMEVELNEGDSKIQDRFTEVGGLNKQIVELKEAIIEPLRNKDLFDAIGIKPPKGVLLYGPPGTGKTLMARACAAETDAVFLKLAGPSLVQMFIGDGAKLVRDAFALAREKSEGRGMWFMCFGWWRSWLYMYMHIVELN